MRRVRLLLVPCLVACTTGCTAWFFSGEDQVDRSQPVALVETIGGVELGATTELGVLTLGRTAVEGPCRVHYFLGPTPIVETGALEAAGGGFTRAAIDLRTQHLRVLDRPPTPADELVAMWTPDGTTTRSVRVQLASVEGVRGDVLADPGEPLPAGATVLCRGEDGGWLFAGLVAARATVDAGPARGTWWTFAGLERVREALLVPVPHPTATRTKHRSDDIMVTQPVR